MSQTKDQMLRRYVPVLSNLLVSRPSLCDPQANMGSCIKNVPVRKTYERADKIHSSEKLSQAIFATNDTPSSSLDDMLVREDVRSSYRYLESFCGIEPSQAGCYMNDMSSIFQMFYPTSKALQESDPMACQLYSLDSSLSGKAYPVPRSYTDNAMLIHTIQILQQDYTVIMWFRKEAGILGASMESFLVSDRIVDPEVWQPYEMSSTFLPILPWKDHWKDQQWADQLIIILLTLFSSVYNRKDCTTTLDSFCGELQPQMTHESRDFARLAGTASIHQTMHHRQSRIEPSMEDCFAAPGDLYCRPPRAQQCPDLHRCKQQNDTRLPKLTISPYIELPSSLQPGRKPFCQIEEVSSKERRTKPYFQIMTDDVHRQPFVPSQNIKHRDLNTSPAGFVCTFYLGSKRPGRKQTVLQRSLPGDCESTPTPCLRPSKRCKTSRDSHALRCACQISDMGARILDGVRTILPKKYLNHMDPDPIRILKQPFRKHTLLPKLSSANIPQVKGIAKCRESNPEREEHSCLTASIGTESTASTDEPNRLQAVAIPQYRYICRPTYTSTNSSTSPFTPPGNMEETRSGSSPTRSNNEYIDRRQLPKKKLKLPLQKVLTCPVDDGSYTDKTTSDVSITEMLSVSSSSIDRSISYGSQRAKGAFKPPLIKLNLESKVGHVDKQSAASSQWQADLEHASGWQTAGGETLHLVRDPKLAAEWSTPVGDACAMNLHSETPAKDTSESTTTTSDIQHLSESRLSFGQPRNDADRLLLSKLFSNQTRLRKLNEDLHSIESALQTETRNETSKLNNLTAKWRSVVQEACDEIFSSLAIKVEQCGGVREWNRLHGPKQWCDFEEEEQRSREGQQDEEFELTSEEKAAMGISEDCYTMEMMLSQLGIPLSLVAWDADLGRWN